ncbi:MAG: cation-transporting P-type ATPase, partial [Clostridia bacterium]|nr:cation-transporting P-type ATPase [Clostridia bacterium]
DGTLTQGQLTLDQSAMTGESREVNKRAGGDDTGEVGDETSLFRGCAVLGGEGKMLVKRVGDATVLGGISREVQEETRDSPLKLRLAKLAGQISVLGYAAAALVAAAFLFHAFAIDSGFQREILLMKLSDLPYLLDTLLEALMLGMTVIVVAVPEGLPMMIAVVLSANIRRMIRDHVLVRKPVGIEAAGSMDLLFTDKTGTLTDGRLSVGRILCAEGDYDDVKALRRAGEARFERYLLSCRLGSEATIGTRSDPAGKGRGREKRVQAVQTAVGGNATDRALTASVMEYGETEGEVLHRLAFDSARKYAATVVRVGARTVTLIKGAPEQLLAHVGTAIDGQGRCVTLDRRRFEARVRQYTGAGERVLMLAVCEGAVDPSALQSGNFPPLTLVCALTLSDRIRPEAREAVKALHGAGVQVVMITGDSPDTAEHIARECGMLSGKTDLVLTGAQLAALSDHQLKETLPRLAVVARALPTDKSRLVRVAQEQERVVGMTGDGINDAPALRRADIGFAMGSGAPVAQEAGDILILDDNLASIVRAVLYGRNIFKSIRKFITLQLLMNFCAVGISMLGPFIGVSAPVTVVQMLWINLIMDTLGGLAFAGEAALPSCLNEKPKRRDEPILGRYMIDEIVWLGTYTIGLFVLFLKHPAIRALYRTTADDLCHLTAFFALFIFASVFHCFNARSDRLHPLAGLARNRLFLLIMGVILIVQILFVYLGGAVLRTMPLTVRELGVTALLAAGVLPVEFLRKLLWRVRGAARKYGKY